MGGFDIRTECAMIRRDQSIELDDFAVLPPKLSTTDPQNVP